MSRAGETNGDGKAHKEGAEVHRSRKGSNILTGLVTIQFEVYLTFVSLERCSIK